MVCSTSLQRSLLGLDNSTAEDTEAFDRVFSMLENLVNHGSNVIATHKVLKVGKRYLRNDFKTHIGQSEHYSDHYTVHALSDSSAREFRGECRYQPEFYKCEHC